MALQRTDVILDSNRDFPLEDFVSGGVWLDTPVGPSDEQHKLDIITYVRSDLLQYPLFGFGAKLYIHSEFRLHETKNALDLNLNQDGYKSKTGVINPEKNINGFSINTKLINRI